MAADRTGPERRQVVRVSILGEEYAIRSDAPAARTRQVAEYLDRVIRQVLTTGAVVDTQKAAILAALQITGELFVARGDAEEVTRDVEALSAEVRRWLPPAKRDG